MSGIANETPKDPKAAKAPEVVTISKDALQGLVDRLDQQAKDLAMLKEVADKSRIQTYKDKHRDTSIRKVNLNTYKGRLVVAWRNVRDEMYQDAMNRFHEKQVMEVITDDNVKTEMDYADFVKALKKVEADVVSFYTTPEGYSMVRCTLDGKSIDIDTTYVN